MTDSDDYEKTVRISPHERLAFGDGQTLLQQEEGPDQDDQTFWRTVTAWGKSDAFTVHDALEAYYD